MKSAQLDAMIKGWFVGSFEPTAFKTKACEVAVKHYRSGESEAAHFHRIATEITLVLKGQVRMAGANWCAGEIIVLAPGDVTDFEAITDATTVVVKVPGASNDKYLC